jgi:hypothetical protein
MSTIMRGCDRRDCSGGRRTTRMTSNPVHEIADGVARGMSGARRGPLSPVMCHAALSLGLLLLAACAASGSAGSSPYHAPNDVDIGHAGGGGGGGSGGGGGGSGM